MRIYKILNNTVLGNTTDTTAYNRASTQTFLFESAEADAV